MRSYDPNRAPDPVQWLAPSGTRRIELVRRFHRRARVRLPNERAGLVPWEHVPENRWAELATVEAWDGDTQVDIHRTLEMFRGILDLTGSG